MSDKNNQTAVSASPSPTCSAILLEKDGDYFAGVGEHGKTMTTKSRFRAAVFKGEWEAALAQRKYDRLDEFRRVKAGM